MRSSASTPASMRLASVDLFLAASSSGTWPISRRYMRTGSDVPPPLPPPATDTAGLARRRAVRRSRLPSGPATASTEIAATRSARCRRPAIRRSGGSASTTISSTAIPSPSSRRPRPRRRSPAGASRTASGSTSARRRPRRSRCGPTRTPSCSSTTSSVISTRSVLSASSRCSTPPSRVARRLQALRPLRQSPSARWTTHAHPSLRPARLGPSARLATGSGFPFGLGCRAAQSRVTFSH